METPNHTPPPAVQELAAELDLDPHTVQEIALALGAKLIRWNIAAGVHPFHAPDLADFE